MYQVRIYRIDTGLPARHASEADRDLMLKRVAALSRVQRPELVDHFTPRFGQPSPFYKQRALARTMVKNAAERRFDHQNAGWSVPAGSLGRKGREALATEVLARSTAESIRIWIVKHLDVVVDPSAVAVVVEQD
jgi:hypothetical protein